MIFPILFGSLIGSDQFKCCAPGETEVIGESFMNTNHAKRKDPFGLCLKYLLKDQGTTKRDIIFNGFTRFQIHFSKTYNRFKNDKDLMALIEKANKEMENAYAKMEDY